MSCTVERLVTEGAAVLGEDTSVAEVARVMAERNLGSLVLTRDGRVVGVFTESDLLRRVIGAGLDPATLAVGEVCTRNLVSVPYDCDCLRALAKMQTHQCRRLLVFRGDHLLGVVHITDLAHALADCSRRKDFLVNALGGLTLILALGVIGILVYVFPEMLRLAGIALGR